MRFWALTSSIVLCLGVAETAHGEIEDVLTVGIAGHAFDHLGNIANQSATAAQSGANIIYSTGVGAQGYQGFTDAAAMQAAVEESKAYLADARAHGIRLAIGYVCATSIVKIDTFDRNWTKEFAASFTTPPKQWLQKDRSGKPLPSWYGGDYRPACMNNPDWRTYEKEVVRMQLEAGHDGIFFDNPTVHPQGCFCQYCMKAFAKFIDEKGDDVERMRTAAEKRPADFLRFRATIAPDFLSEMRRYARSINPAAVVTCNNSLNSPEVFFSQCRTYGYDIHSLAMSEDWVTVEDMGSQPRTLANGSTIEYGPVYEMIKAVSRGKPVTAVTLAEADYHTPVNLMKLAMAEAAAHEASYLSWPTWPENVRGKMADGVRKESDFLRENAALFNHGALVADVGLFLPYRKWVETADCRTMAVAKELARANIQFRVVCEADLEKFLAAAAPKALVVESEQVLNDHERRIIDQYKSSNQGKLILSSVANWMQEIGKLKRAVEVDKAAIRTVVRQSEDRTIVHVMNLNVQRVSSFEDRVTPASDVKLKVRTKLKQPRSVRAMTADDAATKGALEFNVTVDSDDSIVEVTLPRVDLSAILVIE